jgi:hypothetical protein
MPERCCWLHLRLGHTAGVYRVRNVGPMFHHCHLVAQQRLVPCIEEVVGQIAGLATDLAVQGEGELR